MLIQKINKELSKFQSDFLDYYINKYPTHKLISEIRLEDFVNMKSKQLGLELDILLKKRVKNLSYDLYDTTLNRVYEIQGEQHYNYSCFYHKDIGSFDRQKINDSLKRMVCDFFNVEFIEIKDRKDFKWL